MPRFILNQAVPLDGLLFFIRIALLALLAVFTAAAAPRPEFYDSVVTDVRLSPKNGTAAPLNDPASLERIPLRPSDRAQALSCGDIVASRSPGVRVRSTGGLGSFSDVSIRGAGAGRVGIYLDDIPLNSGNGTLFNLNALSGALLEGIEVYRGSIPLGLGVNGTGGVIRLVSAGDRFGNTLRSSVGSGSYGYRTVTLGYLGALPSARVFAAGELIGSDNDFRFVNNNSTAYEASDDYLDLRRNDAFRTFNGIGGFSRVLSNLGTLSGTVYHSHGGKGLPGMPSARTHTARVDHSDASAMLLYRSPRISDRGMSAGLALRRNGYETFYPQNELSFISSLSVHRRDIERMVRPSLDAFFRSAGGFEGTVYADGSLEDFAPEDLTGNGRLDAFGALRGALTAAGRIGVKGKRWEPSATVSLQGVRSVHDAGINRNTLIPIPAGTATDLYVTGGLSLLGHLSQRLKFHGSASRLVQQPALYQLFGDKGATLPMPDLRPEEAWNADLGVRAAWSKGGLESGTSVALFVSTINDQIVAEKSYAQVRWNNNDRGRVIGLELSQHLQWRRLGADLAWTFQDPENRTLNRNNGAYWGKLLPGQQRINLTTALTWSPFSGLEVSGRHRLQSEYYTDYINDPLHRIPGRHLFDAGLHVGLPRRFTLDLNLENITDRKSFDTFGYPIPGRLIILKAGHEILFHTTRPPKEMQP